MTNATEKPAAMPAAPAANEPTTPTITELLTFLSSSQIEEILDSIMEARTCLHATQESADLVVNIFEYFMRQDNDRARKWLVHTLATSNVETTADWPLVIGLGKMLFDAEA